MQDLLDASDIRCVLLKDIRNQMVVKIVKIGGIENVFAPQGDQRNRSITYMRDHQSSTYSAFLKVGEKAYSAPS